MHPPQAIADLIDAPPTPAVSLSPCRQWMLLLQQEGLPPIAQLAKPELRLAGLRINPRNSSRSRASFFTAITLLEVRSRRRRQISGLPADARIGHVLWSPGGNHIAFMLVREQWCELWLVNIAEAQARRWSDVRLNSAGGSPLQWHCDSQSMLCESVPKDRGPQPRQPSAYEAVVQENDGRIAPARTFQDLLKNPHDENLFQHYLTSQLLRISLAGEATELGDPRIVGYYDPSPCGDYLLVETIHRPFSYLVPNARFPRSVEVWDMQGRVVRQVADLPLAEEIPVAIDAVRKGPRSFSWRADAPSTLYWVEAQDQGDPAMDVDVRDQIFLLPAPFDGHAQTLASLEMRFRGISWCDDRLALVREGWWKTRRERLWHVRPEDPAAGAELLFDRSTEDRYHDPGSPLLRLSKNGRRVIQTSADGESIFLLGQGASREGSRPFVDRFHLPSRAAKRLWRSQPPHYEHPIAFMDERQEQLLLGRETVDQPTNYYVRHLSEDSLQRLTEFPHPTPQLQNVHKEVLRYQRKDGVTCTATLYLPPGYRHEDGPLPALFWAYPYEFKSAEAASQMTRSPHRFIRVGPYSPLLWLAQGYAVLDGPTMPIIGEGEAEPNDAYLEQLIASAEAAVDETVRRGVVDRDRIAIGGHSYGAFTAANLLAHCDLFRAGIVASGAYNRTLTPFGFQAEERTLWQAPQVYVQMSPFMHADKIRRPLLIIHGMADENPGVFPLQSERFYQALKGLGATARLVMLPHEGHGYRARESLMHVAAEITNWLETHVKPAPRNGIKRLSL